MRTSPMNENLETESASRPPPPPVADHQLSQQNYPPSNNYFFTTTTPSLIHHLPPPHQPSLPPPPPVIPNMDSWMNSLDMISTSSHDTTPVAAASSSSVAHESEMNTHGAMIMEDEKKNKEVKVGGNRGNSRKATRPRYAFKTRSDDDILDDGFRWRKYGQKAVKNSSFPRSYYRCAHHTCNVKKQVQRLSKDSGIVLTTYEGIHNHPCEKLMETLTPLIRQIQFLSRV